MVLRFLPGLSRTHGYMHASFFKNSDHQGGHKNNKYQNLIKKTTKKKDQEKNYCNFVS